MLQDCNETRPYELLLRWDPISRELAGAAYYEKEVVILGGKVVRNETLDPNPVDVGSADLAAILDTAMASAMAAVERLTQEVQVRDEEIIRLLGVGENKDAEIARLSAVAADLEERLAGNAVVIDGVPQTVTMSKARKALALAGLLGVVDAAVDAAEGQTGDLIRIDWEYAVEVARKSPVVEAMMGVIGMTDEQADALFIQAAALP